MRKDSSAHIIGHKPRAKQLQHAQPDPLPRVFELSLQIRDVLDTRLAVLDQLREQERECTQRDLRTPFAQRPIDYVLLGAP